VLKKYITSDVSIVICYVDKIIIYFIDSTRFFMHKSYMYKLIFRSMNFKGC